MLHFLPIYRRNVVQIAYLGGGYRALKLFEVGFNAPPLLSLPFLRPGHDFPFMATVDIPKF